MDYPNNESEVDIKEEPGESENAIEMTPDFTLSEQNEVDGISYYFNDSLAQFIARLSF